MFPAIQKRDVMFFTAFLLVSAIGLHTIIFHHEHPRFMGGKFEATLHGEDKKRLNIALMLPVFVIGFFTVFWNITFNASPSFFGQRYVNSSILKTNIFLNFLFSRGILHSRVP